MTKEDTKKLIAVLIATYPSFKPENMNYTVELWYSLMADYEYKIMATVLKAYISSDRNGFAPTPGQLIGRYNDLINDDSMGELEAWALVRKAINDSTYHAEERFRELPEIIQKTVGSADNLRNWATSDIKSIETVIGSNFKSAYKTQVERAKQISAMPADVKALIDKVAKGVSLIEERTEGV